MEEFINHQINLVETEKKVDVDETVKMLSMFSPVQLQKRGVALIGLRVSGKIYTLYRLRNKGKQNHL